MVDSRPSSPKTPPLWKRRRSRSRTRTPTRTPIMRKPSTRSRSRTPNNQEKGKTMPKKKLMMEENIDDVFFIADSDEDAGNNNDLEEVNKNGRKRKRPLATMGAPKRNMQGPEIRNFDLDLMSSSSADDDDELADVRSSSKIKAFGETSMQSTSNSTNHHSATFSSASFHSPLPSIPTNSMDDPQSSSKNQSMIFNRESMARTPTPTTKPVLNLTPKVAANGQEKQKDENVVKEIIKRSQSSDEMNMKDGGIINSSKQQNNQQQDEQSTKSLTTGIVVGQNVAGKLQKENIGGNAQKGLIGNNKTKTTNIQLEKTTNNSSNPASTNVLLGTNNYGNQKQEKTMATAANLNIGSGFGNSGEKTQQEIGQFFNQTTAMNLNNQQMANKSINRIPMPNYSAASTLLGSGNGIQQQGMEDLNNGSGIGNSGEKTQQIGQFVNQNAPQISQSAQFNGQQNAPPLFNQQIGQINQNAPQISPAQMNEQQIRPPLILQNASQIGQPAGQMNGQQNNMQNQQIRLSQLDPQSFTIIMQLATETLRQQQMGMGGIIHQQIYPHQMQSLNPAATAGIAINPFFIQTRPPTPTTMPGIGIGGQFPHQQLSVLLEQHIRQCMKDEFKEIHLGQEAARKRELEEMKEELKGQMAEMKEAICNELKAHMDPNVMNGTVNETNTINVSANVAAMDNHGVKNRLNCANAAINTQIQQPSTVHIQNLHQINRNSTCLQATPSSSSSAETPSPQISRQSTLAEAIAEIAGLPAQRKPFKQRPSREERVQKQQPAMEDPKRQEEIDRQIQDIVTKALKVDSTAKSASSERDRQKGQSGEKRTSSREAGNGGNISNTSSSFSSISTTSSSTISSTLVDAKRARIATIQPLPANGPPTSSIEFQQNERILTGNCIHPPPPIHRSTSPIPSTSNYVAQNQRDQGNGKDDDVIFEDWIDRFKWQPPMKKENEVMKEKGTEEVHTISSSDEDDHNYLWNWNGRRGIGGGMQQENVNQNDTGIGTNGNSNNNNNQQGDGIDGGFGLGNSATMEMPTKRLTRGETRRTPDRFQPEEFPRRSRSRSRNRKKH